MLFVFWSMLCGGCDEQEKPGQKKKRSRFREITSDGPFKHDCQTHWPQFSWAE